ncbi:MAG: DNA polymerase III subunit alpha [Spirochaetales bacterium]|nr:DNA polymerase III subunit alpha [Spirochaetales bacterium]
MCNKEYVPLHLRSYFSLLQGLYSPEEICDWAHRQGFPGLAMVDINNFYGLVRFLKAAYQRQLKPMAGVLLQQAGRPPLTAYVLNQQGYARACAILTRLFYANNPYVEPENRPAYDVLHDLVQQGWDGLALCSPHQAALEELVSAGTGGLYAELVFGAPFASLAKWARSSGLPLLAVNHGVAWDKADFRFYPLLRAIDENRLLSEVPASEGLDEKYRIAGAREMSDYFSVLPEALDNALDLFRCTDMSWFLSGSFIFPSFAGLNEEEALARLRSLCRQGVERRYGAFTAAIEERLNYEMRIIAQKGFASYFLVVNDIVRQCPRTCGRGSSAASIVSYLLGITHIDPLAYNLFFERFLNTGRKDPPDIDVDFPWDERDRIFRYVFDKYQGCSAMVANQVSFAGRSCLREPAKALGLDDEEIASLIGLRRLGQVDKVPDYLLRAAGRLRGFPHYIGLHCGGVVITPRAVSEYSHVQPSLSGFPVLAWEKDGTEDARLVKIDLLGNRSLGVLRDTLALVKKHRHRDIPWESFSPLDDKETRSMIEAGQTLGVFYVESPATRQLLKKMRSGDFESLVIASSIIRPAANVYIREFVKRLHGKAYEPLHPLIYQTLKETMGIMVYQEDVSRVAIDLAGFSVEQADQLRKIISKKDRQLTMEAFKQDFFNGASARGVSQEVCQKVWDMILSFTGYSFCKPHSASYALVSYKLAYLKRFYPLEFMASVINNQGGFYSRQTYLNELQRMGFPVLPVCIVNSAMNYAPDYSCSEKPCLRMGLFQLAEISRPFLEQLLEEREKAPFQGLMDFLQRLKPGLPVMRFLIRSGALDNLEPQMSRPVMFWFFFHHKSMEGLFFADQIEAPAFLNDYAENIKREDEFKTLGVLVTCHPLRAFSQKIMALARRKNMGPLASSRDIPRFQGKRIFLAGLIVAGKEVPTKKGDQMIFVSFEDSHSIYETVFFPQAYERFYPQLDHMGMYLLAGKVENDLGALSINVDFLFRVC